jgi:NAD(P)-dependent dehydrogenase (short-subunit alcohol dehydrogenase family)
VADEAGVNALLERLSELLGPRLDVLVNAAGTGSTTTAPDTPLEVWERVFAVNARGTF